MSDVAWQDVKHDVFLAVTDSLDHESFIVRQEEETSTLPRTLACLKHLLPVQLWGERLLQHRQAQHVGIEQLSKLVQLMVRDFYLGVDDRLPGGLLLVLTSRTHRRCGSLKINFVQFYDI